MIGRDVTWLLVVSTYRVGNAGSGGEVRARETLPGRNTRKNIAGVSNLLAETIVQELIGGPPCPQPSPAPAAPAWSFLVSRYPPSSARSSRASFPIPISRPTNGAPSPPSPAETVKP